MICLVAEQRSCINFLVNAVYARTGRYMFVTMTRMTRMTPSLLHVKPDVVIGSYGFTWVVSARVTKLIVTVLF